MRSWDSIEALEFVRRLNLTYLKAVRVKAFRSFISIFVGIDFVERISEVIQNGLNFDMNKYSQG
jgi:hypothetical protein